MDFLFNVHMDSAGLWVHYFIVIPRELVGCQVFGRFHVEKLDLPKPVYFTLRLEQGGYMLVVEFYPIKEDLCVSSGVRDELRYQAPYLRMGSPQ